MNTNILKSTILIVLIIVLSNCTKPSKLQEEFKCQTNYSFGSLEKVEDFNKKFTLNSPKKWSTKLFYNDFETQVMTADTLKSFSNTFILEVSVISGELKIDKTFSKKVITNMANDEQLINLKNQTDIFKDLPAVWFLSNGKKGKFDYHYFQLFAKKGPTEYFKISTKIYGDKLVDERLCESIALMNKIEF